MKPNYNDDDWVEHMEKVIASAPPKPVIATKLFVGAVLKSNYGERTIAVIAFNGDYVKIQYGEGAYDERLILDIEKHYKII